MTLLVASILPHTFEELERDVRRAWDGGADAVELRLDAYEGDLGLVRQLLTTGRDRIWIVTCRSPEEGGSFRGDTRERVSRLLSVARGTGAYVDFEWADWKRSANIRQKIRLALEPQGPRDRLILSAHDFSGHAPSMGDLPEAERSSDPPACIKWAYRGERITGTFAALDRLHETSSPRIALAMGEEGLWTRVLAKKLGAFATYCALDVEHRTAPGQLSLERMRGLFRWDRLDGETRVFGVVGDPVAHSLSPLLHNHWFAEADLNAVYLPLRVRSVSNVETPADSGLPQADRGAAGGSELDRFLSGCVERPWLHVTGLSVTIPHKRTALAWAGEGADAMSRATGAVNTLHFTSDGVRAYNTDAYAAVDALAAALRVRREELAGRRVDVLGSGGAAAAVVYALMELGAGVTVYGRDPAKTRSLCERFGAKPRPWADRDRHKGDILINTTSVGMGASAEASPMNPASLLGYALVFDVIYNPPETKLLREAKAAGIKTLNGLDMFLRQAAMQFTLWTGRTPDMESGRRLLLDTLESLASPCSEPRASARASDPDPVRERGSKNRPTISDQDPGHEAANG